MGSLNYTGILPSMQLSKRGLTPPAITLYVHLHQMQKNAKIPEDIKTSGIVIFGHFRLLAQNIGNFNTGIIA